MGYLWSLKYFSQEVVEDVVLMSIMFTYLKIDAPSQVEWVVEYSHVHVSTLLCTRACPKPLGWPEEEGELVWDSDISQSFDGDPVAYFGVQGGYLG